MSRKIHEDGSQREPTFAAFGSPSECTRAGTGADRSYLPGFLLAHRWRISRTKRNSHFARNRFWSLSKEQRRSADTCCLEGDRELHAVGNPYERDAAAQAKIPVTEPSCPLDLVPVPGPPRSAVKVSAADFEMPRTVSVPATSNVWEPVGMILAERSVMNGDFFTCPARPPTLLYRNMVSKRASLTILRAEFSTDARPESEVWGLSSCSVNQSVLDLDL